jgi:hypothetical protein
MISQLNIKKKLEHSNFAVACFVNFNLVKFGPLCRPIDQGLQLRSQVYPVIAELYWAGMSEPTFCL